MSMITFPKDDAQYRWTAHIKNKMLRYRISAQMIKTILRNPARREEGIAPRTVAVMKRHDTPKRKEEMWVMYIAGGGSAFGGKSSKLIEIQQFTNALKDQMEQHIGPVTQVNPSLKKHITTAVTTSSQKGDGEKAEITQFNATIRTENFSDARA